MAPWEGAAGLPAALFLLHVPGCLALWGPSNVTGTEGGSLSVQCHYEEEFKALNKYWCRRPLFLLCDKTVETKESESEVKSGHVSIRDHPANLTFTVTVENLTKDDGGQYWCGVNMPLLSGQKGFQPDPVVEILVIVNPAPNGPRSTEEEPPTTNPYPRSLLSSVHFLLLVFLEVPLLLGMLSAVLWVNRPQRGS